MFRSLDHPQGAGPSVLETEEHVIPTYMLDIHLIPIWQIRPPLAQYIYIYIYISVKVWATSTKTLFLSKVCCYV